MTSHALSKHNSIIHPINYSINIFPIAQKNQTCHVTCSVLVICFLGWPRTELMVLLLSLPSAELSLSPLSMEGVWHCFHYECYVR